MLIKTWMESLRLDLTGHYETLIRLYLIAFISNDDNRSYFALQIAHSTILNSFNFSLFTFNSIQWLNCPIWVVYIARRI